MNFAISLLLIALSGSASKPCFSPTQVRQLALEAMRHTPEQTHFSKGARFAWVVLEHESDSCPEVTAAIRGELRKHYKVYESVAQLPAEAIQKSEIGTSYAGGFVFRVSVKKLSDSEVEVRYHDFETPIAASDQTIRYQWKGGRWHVTYSGGMAVS